jgi:tellurite resistance protein TerC
MHNVGSVGLWAGFLVFVLAMLALDLGVFHRKAHVVRFREALAWSLVWIALSLAFNVLVWWLYGGERALEFLTAYLLEKSLSVDNLFVFLVVFSAVGIPPQHQHRVLFWGVLSALVLRAIMILAGVALLTKFHWLIYIFGGFLIVTGVKLFVQRNSEEHPEQGWTMRLARKLVPNYTSKLDGPHFFTVENGKRMATPLLLALVLVEITDVVFAVDSVPAVLAVSDDVFIVFTSNVFAILGLRSLFFLLAGLVDKFRYLKVGLAGVLVFVGLKMTLADVYKLPAYVSLGVIVLILGGAAFASIIAARREDAKAGAEHDDDQRRQIDSAKPGTASQR